MQRLHLDSTLKHTHQQTPGSFPLLLVGVFFLSSFLVKLELWTTDTTTTTPSRCYGMFTETFCRQSGQRLLLAWRSIYILVVLMTDVKQVCVQVGEGATWKKHKGMNLIFAAKFHPPFFHLFFFTPSPFIPSFFILSLNHCMYQLFISISN